MGAPDDDGAIGSVLGDGRYEILALLGRGGMGDVYRARDRASQTDVALKTLHRRLAAEARHLARFRREAEVTSALSHPNIVAVLDHGVEGDGTPWIVMEVLEGESLSKLASREAPFEVSRVVRIGRQLAHALAAVHGVGVVHRDLKPANVMTTGPTGREEVKVVDFGIARFFGTGSYERLTATGQVIGTPSYMAPEQAFGGIVDGRTDIYAVGSILCALLTGSPAYGRGDFYEVLTRLLGNERVSLGKSHPQLGPIVDVIECCLAFDPEQRYASMAELDAALRRHDPSPSTTLVDWSPRVPLHTLRLDPEPTLDAVTDVAQTAFLRAARGRGRDGGTLSRGEIAPQVTAAPSSATAVSAAPPPLARPPVGISRRWWSLAAVGLLLSIGAAAAVALVIGLLADPSPSTVSEGPPPSEVVVGVTVVPAIAPRQVDYAATVDAPDVAAAPAFLDMPLVDSGAAAASPPMRGAASTMRSSMARASRHAEASMEASTSPPTHASRRRGRITYEIVDPAAWTRAQVRAGLAAGFGRGSACVAAVSGDDSEPFGQDAHLRFHDDGELYRVTQGAYSGGRAGRRASRELGRCVELALQGARMPALGVELPREEKQVRLRITVTP